MHLLLLGVLSRSSVSNSVKDSSTQVSRGAEKRHTPVVGRFVVASLAVNASKDHTRYDAETRLLPPQLPPREPRERDTTMSSKPET